MKDHVEIGHLTKYDAFRVNRDRDQVWILKYGSKSIQTSLISRQRPPKLCGNCKIPSCTYYLKEAETKIAVFAHFKEYHGNHKNFKGLYDSWGRCLKIPDVCMDFEPDFKIYSLVSVHPKTRKASYLVK